MTKRIKAADEDTATGSERAGAAAARRLASQIVNEWEEGARADAVAAFSAHPELRQFRSIALNLAYEEYCLRTSAGENLDRDEFASRFADFRTEVLRQLEVHSALANVSTCEGLDLPVVWPGVGDEFLGFQLQKELGRGAIARVFVAKEAALGERSVVVKVARRGGDEARVLGKLSHKNVVPVYSVSADQEDRFTAVCMPYLGSVTLADLIDELFRGGRLPTTGAQFSEALARLTALAPPVEPAPVAARFGGAYLDVALGIIRELAEGLAFTHAKGILHRDLKPSNVLVTPAGVPMLLDFNLSSDPAQAAPRIGGTLPFMSPEQLAHTIAVIEPEFHGPQQMPPAPDARSDLFSLGLVAYLLLTGVQPFERFAASPLTAETAAELLARHREIDHVADLRRLGVQKSIAALLGACLRYDSAARPASADELVRRLKREQSRVQRVRRWTRARPVRTMAAAIVVSVAAVWGGAAYLQRPSPEAVAWADAIERLAARDFASAERQFQSVLATRPGLVSAVLGLARAQHGQKMWLDAAANYELAFKEFEEKNQHAMAAESAAAAGFCQLQAKNRLVAVSLYKAAVKTGHASPDTYAGLASLCWQIKGLADEAIIHSSDGLRRYPRHWGLRKLRGNFLLQSVKVTDDAARRAYADLRLALDLAPQQFAEIHLDAAIAASHLVHTSASMRERVRQHLRAAVEHGLDPENVRGAVVFQKALGPDGVDDALRGVKSLRAFVPSPHPILDPLTRALPLPDGV